MGEMYEWKHQASPTTEPVHLMGGVSAAPDSRGSVKQVQQQSLRPSDIPMSSGLITDNEPVIAAGEKSVT